MSSIVKVTAKLETSDHEGYCSGNECQYERKTVQETILLPAKIRNVQDLAEHNLEGYLPKPDLNYYGSCYCDLSSKCEKHGLRCHDYKYTIKSIEILNSDSESDSEDNADNEDEEAEEDEEEN